MWQFTMRDTYISLCRCDNAVWGDGQWYCIIKVHFHYWRSDNGGGTQHSFLYQLIMEKDERLVLPTTQQLFELSFLQMKVKLEEVKKINSRRLKVILEWAIGKKFIPNGMKVKVKHLNVTYQNKRKTTKKIR